MAFELFVNGTLMRGLALHGNLAVADPGQHARERSLDDLLWREGDARAEAEARVDAGVLEHALHHLAEAAGLAANRFAVSPDAVAAHHALRQVFGSRANHGDRRA